MNHVFLKNTLGSKEIAENVAYRAQTVVPAYQHFIQKQGFKAGEPFERLPLTDKESYVLAYPFPELLADNYEESFAIVRSSGSSGNPFYWLTLKSSNQSSTAVLKTFLESTFAVHQKKTLAIVGYSLGSWVGGDSWSWVLKSMAIDTPYPFWVFSPGNHLDEIIKIVCQINPFVDQIILFIVPSAIAHFHLKASQLNQSLPLDKLRYIVGAEPFPESLRISLQKRAAVDDSTSFMFSLYGSADTDTLGVEFPTSVALRKLLYRNHVLAHSLGIESPIPHFFHFIATNTFLETVKGCLCVTRWQGIPLVRYLVYDQVALYSWKELKQAILSSEYLNPDDAVLIKIISNSSDQLPDLLAVTGRADNCLILKGTTFTEYMLDEAVKCEELHEILTGLYRARIVYEEDKQYLALDLEIRQSISSDQQTIDRVYHSLIKTIGRVQPEFFDDWQNFYREWDSNPAKRVLKLNFLPWPSLSQTTETTIKQRGIVK